MAAQDDPDAVPLRAIPLHDDLEPKASLMALTPANDLGPATGHACDFMVTTGGVMATGSAQAQGDQVAQYAISNASSLGIKYVIWRQRIYDMRSPGWRMMENRGGNTANHYDHVHISVF